MEDNDEKAPDGVYKKEKCADIIGIRRNIWQEQKEMFPHDGFKEEIRWQQ